jgi:hypothetical protein
VAVFGHKITKIRRITNLSKIKISTTGKQGRWLDLRSKITGDLDETGVEAEVSTLEYPLTLKSSRGLIMKKIVYLAPEIESPAFTHYFGQ